MPAAEMAAKVERLRKEEALLREERDLLKKATAYFVNAFLMKQAVTELKRA